VDNLPAFGSMLKQMELKEELGKSTGKNGISYPGISIILNSVNQEISGSGNRGMTGPGYPGHGMSGPGNRGMSGPGNHGISGSFNLGISGSGNYGISGMGPREISTTTIQSTSAKCDYFFFIF